ncbi:MAG TPA: DNA gyrase subunit A [Anaerolineae bacterium]|nr:DNA gyrase subunit A [Anaerolineae bacterium]
MEIGIVRQVDINREMQEAYLDYAMSVIVSRALPDVRDGLKPVHRRILYTMHTMGLGEGAPYRKSARIVGECLGKYHPHGDAAVYEAMARMAQDFSMRYPLVDGQGNFGSVDGDPPAAMRYTEARLTSIACEMLTDINKDTVDFTDNFDGTLKEPVVLPAAFPNLLVNGSSGIAVAMATNIPPHNLGEVCDALIYMIDHAKKMDDIGVEELMQFIKGPDFPTGGIVYRYRPGEGDGGPVDAIRAAYAMGRGHITVQAKAHIEEMSRGRHRIVVTELPYQVNKTSLIERIAQLVHEGRISGIADLRDESDRRGMRLCIELTRTVEPRQVLAQLFRLTPMQMTFGVNMLALVDGEPRLLSLKRALELYLEHRREIVRRRSQFELARARERAHILEGLLIALAHLDEVIAIIRRSRTTDSARRNLRRKLKLTEVQAQAILDMPLKRLAALERRKIEQEHREKVKRIRELERLLRSPKRILALIKQELQQIKAKYADPRRTQIVERERGELTARELLPEEEVLVCITRDGRVARWPPANFRRFANVRIICVASARDDLAVFSADGRGALIPVHQIPEGVARERGMPLSGLVAWGRVGADGRPPSLAAAVVLPYRQEGRYLVLATEGGRIKRIAAADFRASAHGCPEVISLDKGDRLGWACLTDGEQEVILVTRRGQAIRFSEEEVRPMGLAAAGVWAIKLAEGDAVVDMAVVRPDGELLVAMSQGYCKRTALADFPAQRRYGVGVVAAKVSSRTGQVVAAKVVQEDGKVLLVSAKGATARVKVSAVRRMGRAAGGSRINQKTGQPLLKLAKGDSLADVVVLPS